MPVIEGAELAGVAIEPVKSLHTARFPLDLGTGGAYKVSLTSGQIGSSQTANTEVFQFRFAPTANRLAIVNKVAISGGTNAQAGGAALATLRLTVARNWIAPGTGGTRTVIGGNNCKLRTSFPPSEVNDVAISNAGALGVGTKTLDTIDEAELAFSFGASAMTTSIPRELIPKTLLLDTDCEGDYPLVLASLEGFVIRIGAVGFPAGASWNLAVDVLWFEINGY